MKRYFAPLEGITGYIYRNTFEEFFGGVDCYYSPFVVTRDSGIMKKKEMRDILPENNEKYPLVPQLLTNRAENFIQAAAQMASLGYEEVNLNLGCPSGTVVSKSRGAGFLKDLDKLQFFLDEIFRKTPCAISIKTRIGMENPEEFYQILSLYNQYPIKELIIHPRTRSEFYKGTVHQEIFLYAYQNSRIPVCYNGDICTVEDYQKIEEAFDNLPAVMIGRGLIANPALALQIQGKKAAKEQLFSFQDTLLERYREVMSGDIHALHKMKEVWIYMAPHFTNYEKYLKKIKKTNRLDEYKAAVYQLFQKEDWVTA